MPINFVRFSSTYYALGDEENFSLASRTLPAAGVGGKMLTNLREKKQQRASSTRGRVTIETPFYWCRFFAYYVYLFQTTAFLIEERALRSPVFFQFDPKNIV